MVKHQLRTNRCLARTLLITLSWLTLVTAGGFNGAGQKINGVNSNVNYKGWEPIFFQAIDKRAKIAKIKNLRSVALGKNDLELRVWIGFGPVALKGFVINRRGSAWSATYLKSINSSVARKDYQKNLGQPKSGWEAFWKSLVDDSVLTLPGSTKPDWLDGESFVVEIKTGNSYRTYMYDNPELKNLPEGRKIIEIVQIIRDEFAVPR